MRQMEGGPSSWWLCFSLDLIFESFLLLPYLLILHPTYLPPATPPLTQGRQCYVDSGSSCAVMVLGSSSRSLEICDSWSWWFCWWQIVMVRDVMDFLLLFIFRLDFYRSLWWSFFESMPPIGGLVSLSLTPLLPNLFHSTSLHYVQRI